MWSNLCIFICFSTAAVSCSSIGPGLGGAGFVFWITGKLGRAWFMVHGIGAWRCMAVHAASCMGGGPAGGWVKACVYAPMPCTMHGPAGPAKNAMHRCHALMPCIDAMHGPACLSTKTQIPPHQTCRHQDYMKLLLFIYE